MFSIFFISVYHKFDVNVKRRLLGLTKSENVQPLNEEMAVELGANMLGEAFLYSFLVGLLVIEHIYSSRVSEGKEAEKKKYLQSLETKIEELGLSVAKQETELVLMQEMIGVLESENDKLKQKMISSKLFK